MILNFQLNIIAEKKFITFSTPHNNKEWEKNRVRVEMKMKKAFFSAVEK